MDYRNYIVNMITSLTKEYDKLYLYTLTTRELVYIKEELLMSDNVKVNCE
jgi:hypothetical protein